MCNNLNFTYRTQAAGRHLSDSHFPAALFQGRHRVVCTSSGLILKEAVKQSRHNVDILPATDRSAAG
jgi:hypothetical protein